MPHPPRLEAAFTGFKCGEVPKSRGTLEFLLKGCYQGTIRVPLKGFIKV